MTSKDFDPNAPLVDEKGIEYENLADFLRGKPVECHRNHVARVFSQQAKPELCAGLIHVLYTSSGRNLGDPVTFPQGLERFAPKPSGAGSSQGDGQPGAGEAPAGVVHPAPEPPVHGRLGS